MHGLALWFDRVWAYVLRWLRVLWICRVSVLSIAAGLTLAWFAVQVQDLFLDRDASPGYWIAFFALLFWVWAFPVHYAARLLLQFDFGVIPRDDAEAHQTAIQSVPRWLGYGCFLAILVAIARAWFNLPACEPGVPACADTVADARTQLVVLGVVTVLALAGFFYVIRNRRWLTHVASLFVRRRLRLAAPPPAVDATEARRNDRTTPLLPYYRPRASRYRDKPIPPDADTSRRLSRATWGGLFVLALVSLVTLGALLTTPLELAAIVPRACLLVLVLGAWVPFASYLAYWSHMRRFPVLLLVVLLPGFASLLVGDSHDLRRLPDAAQTELGLDEAIVMWRDANPGDNAPIVVASAGGASRAGYMTARLLALLSDADPTFERRLFAISGVSGGSVGAAFYAAALRTRGDGQTLRELAAVPAAGDFMSPVFAGFALRDALGIPALEDRAVALEQSWEQAFAAQAPGATAGLDAGFAGFAPSPAGWRPLLLLNSASGGTGRRVVVSHLENWDEVAQRPLFTDSYSLADLAPGQTDVALSTAAGLSARFPLITPAANLRRADGSMRDRLVDGGYHENFGAGTARDLVEALELRGLRPVVLQISNDPGLKLRQPPEPPSASRLPLSAILAPLKAFFATRGAHGTGASVALRDHVCPPSADDTDGDGELRPCGRWGHVRLKGRVREVSMSWWLSQPVRYAIDSQLCGDTNVATVRAVLGDRAADGMCRSRP